MWLCKVISREGLRAETSRWPQDARFTLSSRVCKPLLYDHDIVMYQTGSSSPRNDKMIVEDHSHVFVQTSTNRWQAKWPGRKMSRAKEFPSDKGGFGRGGCRWYVLFLSFVCLLYYSLRPAILLVPTPLPCMPLIAPFKALVPSSMPPVPPPMPLLPLPIVYHPLCLTDGRLGPVISWGLPSQPPSVTISGSFKTCFSPS